MELHGSITDTWQKFRFHWTSSDGPCFFCVCWGRHSLSVLEVCYGRFLFLNKSTKRCAEFETVTSRCLHFHAFSCIFHTLDFVATMQLPSFKTLHSVATPRCSGETSLKATPMPPRIWQLSVPSATRHSLVPWTWLKGETWWTYCLGIPKVSTKILPFLVSHKNITFILPLRRRAFQTCFGDDNHLNDRWQERVTGFRVLEFNGNCGTRNWMSTRYMRFQKVDISNQYRIYLTIC